MRLGRLFDLGVEEIDFMRELHGCSRDGFLDVGKMDELLDSEGCALVACVELFPVDDLDDSWGCNFSEHVFQDELLSVFSFLWWVHR